MSELDALISWLNTFESLDPISRPSELSDGVFLNSVLCIIDPDFFPKDTVKENIGDNRVLKELNIKRLLGKLKDYYEEKLHQAIEVSINKEAISKDADIGEIKKLIELVLGVAVQCPENGTYISKIVSLDDAIQDVLMVTAQDIMQRGRRLSTGGGASGGNSGGGSGGGASGSGSGSAGGGGGGTANGAEGAADSNKGNEGGGLPSKNSNESGPLSNTSGGGGGAVNNSDGQSEALVRLTEERDTLKKKLSDTRADLELANLHLTEARNEVSELRERVAAVEAAKTGEIAAAVEVAKGETERLRKTLEQLDREHHEAVVAKDAALKEVRELTNKLKSEDSSQLVRSLRDELEVLRSKADSAEKLEASVSKLKDRLAAMGDLKANLSTMEAENSRLLDVIAEKDVALKRSATVSTELASYKAANASLESKVSSLTLEFERATTRASRYKDEIDSLNAASTQAAETIATLQRRIDTLSAEASSATPGESLGDVFSKDLTGRVAQLEAENRALRVAASGAGDSEQSATLMSLLDQANRLKAQAEEDRDNAVRKAHKLEDDIESLQTELKAAVKARTTLNSQVGESSVMIEKLAAAERTAAATNAALATAEARAITAETELSEVKTALAAAQSELVDLKTRLSILGKDKDGMIAELTENLTKKSMEEVASLNGALATASRERDAASSALADLTAKHAQLESELRTANTDINTLLKAKDKLQTDYLALKDELLAKERAAGAEGQSRSVIDSEVYNNLQSQLLAANGRVQELEIIKLQNEKEAFIAKSEIEKLMVRLGDLDRLESRLREAEEEKERLEGHLVKARDFITAMPKGGSHDGGVAQAEADHRVRVLESSLKDKENEVEFYKRSLKDTRDQAKREERLVASAFYGLGLELQRLKATERVQGSVPQSWLGQQRQRVSPVRRARPEKS